MKRLFGYILLLSLVFTPALVSQETEATRRSPGLGRLAVTYDLGSGQLDSALPFDVSFDLVAKDKTNKVRAVAVSLFQAKESFQVVACGPESKPSCSQESWRCIAERGPGAMVNTVWPTNHRPEDRAVDCSFTPDVATLAPVQKSAATTEAAFYLPFPPLRASREYQILLRYVERQDTPDTRAQEVLSEFRKRVPAHLERHLRNLAPQTDEQGAFPAFAGSLLDDLQGAARSRGLELIADPQDPLLQVLGAAGILPVEEELIQLLRREVPGLLTERQRFPLFVDQCKSQLLGMKSSLENLFTAIEGTRVNGVLPSDLRGMIQTANLTPLLEEDARDQVALLARAQVPDPCGETDASVLNSVTAAYADLEGNLRGLQQAVEQRQPSVVPLLQAASTAADTAFRLRDFTRRIAGARTRFDETVAELTDALTLAAVQDRILFARASTVGTFESRQKWQIAGDFGFAYAWDIDEAAPYIGTNFYFRPVNKQASLKGNPFRQPLRRLSSTIGVVLTDIGDGRTRDPLLETGKLSLLAGGGYRITDAVRLSVGAVLFQKRDPNPLIDDGSLAASPYASLSLDWDLQALVAWFGRVFRPSP
jgi:hypothetical protein